ncbi:hypothetical protein ACFSJY_14665 [Thalassotalea euphylliae]|uniref:hypothetical protein n=1 Tax=Thalassotalea euphylliae TaxID=1655234 RepID=UPI003636DF23
MFAILTDRENIAQVFEKYSVPQALQVKQNFDAVFTQLKIPSAELIAQMEAEGLSLSDLDTQVSKNSRAAVDIPASVIRSNLYRMFLNHQELLVAMEGLAYSERIEVREMLDTLEHYLKLPSPALMERMAAEGIAMPNAAKKATSACSDSQASEKVLAVKDKLSKALGGQENAPVNNIKEFPKVQTENDRILAVKNRLNAIAVEQQLREDAIEPELEIEGSAAKKFLLNMIKT